NRDGVKDFFTIRKHLSVSAAAARRLVGERPHKNSDEIAINRAESTDGQRARRVDVVVVVAESDGPDLRCGQLAARQPFSMVAHKQRDRLVTGQAGRIVRAGLSDPAKLLGAVRAAD